MYLRPKTKRRLLILGSAFSLIGAVLLSGYLVRSRRIAAQVADARARAMAASAAGDHQTALEAFRFYLDETKTADKSPNEADAEAVLAYAKSRAAVETDKGRNLFEAVKILERYMRLRPNDAEARRMLLELEPRIGYNDEALQLADATLAENPEDADALRARVRALRSKGMQDKQFYAQALAAAEHLTNVRPDDLRAQVEVLRLMSATKRSDEEIVRRAQSLKAAHPDDPRCDLLLATAYLLTHQPEPAAASLKTAAEAKTMPDATFAMELARHLEAFSMFPLAQDVIERGAAAFPSDADLARASAWRLWQAGRNEELLKRLATVDLGHGDATLVALRALSNAAMASDHRGDAPAAQQGLARRKSDPSAAGWAIVLAASIGDAGTDVGKLAALYRSALDRDPQNPVAAVLLGDVYARMGEAELANDSWQSAARLAPAWAAPCARLARAAIDAGNYADATRFAEAAYRRAPDDLGAAADWVVASYGLLQAHPGDAAARAELLKTAEAVQKDALGEPRTLPTYVALLAEAGRKEDAAKRARAALAGAKPDADLLTRLAVVNRTHELGLEDDLAQMNSAAEQSPTAAFRTAALLLQAGRTSDALEGLNASKARAVTAGAASLPWDIATLELRDLAADEATAADWAKLADANPKDLSLQSAVLRSPARGRDRGLWKRAVDRVKELTGPEAHLWQVEQARLALASDAGGDELLGAIALLEGVTKVTVTSAEPRRLLALAYERRSRERGGEERRGALARAIEEIGKAADLRPADPAITRDLVAIYRAAGQNEQAAQFLDRLVLEAGGKPDAPTRAWVADAYSELGEFEKAAGLLDDAGDAAGVARLAALRRIQGDPASASTLYKRILPARDADAPMLIEAAEFFADTGDVTTAQQFITKLTTLPLKPGALEIIRGRFQERRGKFDEALAAYRAATAVPSVGANAWHELCGFLLRQRHYAEAVAAANDGLMASPNDGWLPPLRDRAAALQKVAEAAPSGGKSDDPSIAALLAALSADPSDEPAVRMVELLSNTITPILEQVRPLADRYPQFMPLQYRAVRLALSARQFVTAEQLARRAARNRPDDPEAARLVAATLVAQGEWTKAKPAALAWRTLAWNNPLPADLLTAECEIECGEPAAAEERLRACVSGVAREDVRVNTVYARALIGSGRAGDAVTLLEPRASSEPAWRSAWLSLATAHRDAVAASAWIDRVTPRIAETDAAGRERLAEAWLAVGQRFGASDAYHRAFDVIRVLPAANLDGNGQGILALCAQAVGDYDAAVTAHRAVLAFNPQLPEAKNNLAYALMLRGKREDLIEAKRLADDAVAAKPDNATFRDTLARVEARTGNLDAAAAEFRTALRAEPYHLEARLGLADVLAATRQEEEGRVLLASVEKDLRLSPALPPYLAAQFESVRKTLAKP